MTTFIGAPGHGATRGERLLYQRIKLAFPDEPGMYCYVEPAIGDDRPDLVLMDPRFGAIVFEIKDYNEDHLVEISKNEDWLLLAGNGTDGSNEGSADGGAVPQIRCPNPFVQVYRYWRTMQHYFASTMFHQAVVLSNISGKSDRGRHVIANAPARISLFFKEDLATKATFVKRFHASFPMQNVAQPLAPGDFKLLRANLVPTCRLPSTRQSRIRLDEPLLDKDALDILDAEQEKLACALGDGHRLFFGVAGSGKTVILVARARYLAHIHPDWRILLVCFNKLLASHLQRLINPQDCKATVVIEHFHRLARQVIKAAGPPYSVDYAVSERDAGQDKSRFFSEQVPALFARVVRETNPPKYDAILVDEAQDFDSSWYAPLLGLLNPATQSLLITLDGLQGIYARKSFNWSDVGIRARGRVVRLQRSYRNPAEIGKAAARVLPKSLTDLVGTGDEFLATSDYARPGGMVDIVIIPGDDGILDHVATRAREFLDRNWSILISFRQNIFKLTIQHPIFPALDRHGIPSASIASGGPASNLISIATPQAAKGLEADAVIIPHADEYSTPDELQRLYVAMTRASRVALLVASKSTPVLERIEPFVNISR